MAKVVMLDRKREFGQVIGAGGPRFEQDGKLFDVAGRLYVAPPSVPDLDESADPKEQLKQAVHTIETLKQELIVAYEEIARLQSAVVTDIDDTGDGFPDLPGTSSPSDTPVGDVVADVVADVPATSEVDQQLAAQGVL